MAGTPGRRMQDPLQLLRHLLELNRETFEDRRYQAAHHLLAAAVHLADELQDIQGVDEIEQRSVKQQGAIDDDSPTHVLSTIGAKRRGTLPLFTSLGRTAHAAASRLRAESARKRAEHAMRQTRSNRAGER